MVQVLQDELQTQFSPENLSSKIVSFAGSLWYVKTLNEIRSARRELLAYLLGKELVNIAEVRAVNKTEIALIRRVVELPASASPDNTVMVRLANCYSVNDFPLQELSAAAAGELVFSLWVRRRDAHLYNRAYVENVPIFFDHHVALGMESYSVNIEEFFRTDNHSYAGNWHVQKRIDNAPLRTAMFRETIRAYEDKWDMHYIDCPQRFIDAARQIAHTITSSHRNLPALIRQAGFRGWEVLKLYVFLKRTTKSLRKDVEHMLEVVAPGLQTVRETSSAGRWKAASGTALAVPD
jgi:hypothetical protein